MAVLHFLRVLGDLGLYYCAAGTIAALCGGQLALELLLLQSACFALSSALRRSKAARLAALLPALLVYVVPAAPADRISAAPALAYLACLAWADNYQLSRYRQADVFHALRNVVLAVLALGGYFAFISAHRNALQALLSVGIPAALIAGAASILLMRSLRHEARVYLQPGYQAANLAGVVLLALAGLALGSEWALRAALFVVSSVYQYVIFPLLMGLAVILGGLMSLLYPLIVRLLQRRGEMEENPNIEAAGDGAFQEQLEKLDLPTVSLELVLRIVLALAILAAAAALVLLFRWMARRHPDEGGVSTPYRRDLPGGVEGERPRPGSYAGRIRRQYRAYLRMCQNRGLEFDRSDTSTDVGRKSLPEFPDEEALCALRDLYQRARYSGEASREDYQQFKNLIGKIKKLPDRQKARV